MAEYGYSTLLAQAGQIVDATPSITTSFAAEEIIEMGRPLMRGTDPAKQVKNYVSGGDFTKKFLGISGYTATEIKGNYPVGDMVSVLEWGRIYVPLITGLTITAGDIAYLNQTTNSITNVSSTNQIKIGRFQSSGTSDGLTGSQVFALEIIPGFEV
jgi:hypothetical protein